jgi:hypothetical protein
MCMAWLLITVTLGIDCWLMSRKLQVSEDCHYYVVILRIIWWRKPWMFPLCTELLESTFHFSHYWNQEPHDATAFWSSRILVYKCVTVHHVWHLTKETTSLLSWIVMSFSMLMATCLCFCLNIRSISIQNMVISLTQVGVSNFFQTVTIYV